jgi:hypothetical protein
MANSGWYRDPTGQADGRYWDGQRWSDQVDRQGVTVSTPIDPANAETPPVSGSEYVVPSGTGTQTETVQPAKSSLVGPVFGAIAVVVAIVALVVALSNNNDDDTEENPTTTTLTETPETTAGE